MNRSDRIGRQLRLKDLHTLQTIADVGSMAKASQRLALSQPAISKAIADMESTFGALLLDRSSRGVELTPSGRLLVARARVIFDEVRQGVSDIDQASDPTQGEVRIGTTEPVTVVVSEVISILVRKYPRIRYHITVSDTDTLGRDLRDRALDVVVTRWVSPLIADDFAAQPLFNSPLGVMAERRHPLVGRKKLSLADLTGEQWTLSPANSFLGRIVSDLFHRRKLPLPTAVVTTISIYMRLNLLANGRFLTVLPLTMLRHRSNSAWLRALNVDLSDSSAPIAVITLKKRRGSGALELFQAACVDVAKSLV